MTIIYISTFTKAHRDLLLHIQYPIDLKINSIVLAFVCCVYKNYIYNHSTLYSLDTFIKQTHRLLYRPVKIYDLAD